MSAAGPVREGERPRWPRSAARGRARPARPAGTAADTERVAVEHATTVLTWRSPGCAPGPGRSADADKPRARPGRDAGAEPATLLNRAQALGWSGRTGSSWSKAGAHRDDDIDMFPRRRPGSPPPEWVAAGATAARRDRAGRCGGALGPSGPGWSRCTAAGAGSVGGRVLELDGFRTPAGSGLALIRRPRAAPSGSRCSTASASTKPGHSGRRRPWSTS
jgi:hypothetical protein